MASQPTAPNVPGLGQIKQERPYQAFISEGRGGEKKTHTHISVFSLQGIDPQPTITAAETSLIKHQCWVLIQESPSLLQSSKSWMMFFL